MRGWDFFAHAQGTAPWNMLVFANGVIDNPYVFAHFHLSSQVNASAAVDLVTHGVGCGEVGGGEGWWGGVITYLALANMFHPTL